MYLKPYVGEGGCLFRGGDCLFRGYLWTRFAVLFVRDRLGGDDVARLVAVGDSDLLHFCGTLLLFFAVLGVEPFFRRERSEEGIVAS